MHRHIVLMATYKVIPQAAGRGFNIKVIGANGARQTLLGFATEADAEAWIAADRALDAGWISMERASPTDGPAPEGRTSRRLGEEIWKSDQIGAY